MWVCLHEAGSQGCSQLAWLWWQTNLVHSHPHHHSSHVLYCSLPCCVQMLIHKVTDSMVTPAHVMWEEKMGFCCIKKKKEEDANSSVFLLCWLTHLKQVHNKAKQLWSVFELRKKKEKKWKSPLKKSSDTFQSTTALKTPKEFYQTSQQNFSLRGNRASEISKRDIWDDDWKNLQPWASWMCICPELFVAWLLSGCN